VCIATASHGGISRNLNLDFRESPECELRLNGVLRSSPGKFQTSLI
jgi:hypothetical protein